jgi:hypothetical protein
MRNAPLNHALDPSAPTIERATAQRGLLAGSQITLLYLPPHMTRRDAAFALALGLLPSLVDAQSSRSDAGVEDIVILRSLRLSRVTPTDFCAASRVGFSASAEDRYDFKPVATDPTSGKVTNASGARAGTLHACFGPTSDSMVVSFYAEGDVGGASLVGHGQCRMTKADSPEAGISLWACQLDLTGLPSGYLGGQLTTNTLLSRALLGAETDPPGYTQASIVTVRLWKTR